MLFAKAESLNIYSTCSQTGERLRKLSMRVRLYSTLTNEQEEKIQTCCGCVVGAVAWRHKATSFYIKGVGGRFIHGGRVAWG